MNTDFRKPTLEGLGFEFGVAASNEKPYMVYYLRFLASGDIVSAEKLEQLPELLVATGNHGKAACEWLLNHDSLPISGAGEWLPNVMDQLYPGSVRREGGAVCIDSVVNDQNSVDISFTTFLGRYGWVVTDNDGQAEYRADRDPHAKYM